MKQKKLWMMAAILTICGTMALTSCTNDDNPTVGDTLAENIVGKWIHVESDGEAVMTGMKSVYTFTKNGSELEGYYSMSMTESGVWVNKQPMEVAFSGTDMTLTVSLGHGVTVLVNLTDVSVSGDDLRFTAKTTISKDGQVTAVYGPRQEYYIRTEADYAETIVGLWEIQFTSDDPEYELFEPYREEYRADGTFCSYDLVDGQWVEEEVGRAEYFVDGPLFYFRVQNTEAGIDWRENWENVSYSNGKMVNKTVKRCADGSIITVTAHLTKVE